MHDTCVRISLTLLYKIRQPRSEWRDVLVIDLGKISEHHYLGVCPHAADHRLKLELGETLRFINDHIGVIEGASAHEVERFKLDIGALLDIADAAITGLICAVQYFQVIVKSGEPGSHFFLFGAG